ncbi:kinetochore protein, partial [Cutibacterium acnes subsp. acnes]|nr:kinetochore protein [Cutibacterium acnes subsp. acnes]
SHDHRPNRNIYRFSSYSVRRQSSMASESMQAQLP